MSRSRPVALAAALVVLSAGIAVALYGRALDYPLVWMDEREIGAGEIVLGDEPWTAAFTRPLHRSDSASVSNPYYRPLQILVATAVHRVAGPTPRAYRLVSLAAAVGTCVVFGALAAWLFGSAAPALVATALVAAHPAGIESWLWISGLGEALAAPFAIASLGLALGALARGGRRGAACGALSIACLVLALAGKEKAVVVPALLGAALVAFHAGPGRAVAPWSAAPGAVARGVALVAAQGLVVAVYALLWRPAVLGGAVALAAPIGGSRAAHLLSALASWPESMAWLFAPWRSSTSDAVRVVTSPGDAVAWAGVALALGSLAAFAWLVRRGRPVAAFGLAWVWISFLPTANLLPQIHARAERYLFLSAFGAALLVVDALWAVMRAGPRPGAGAARWRGVAAASIGALLALVLAWRTAARVPDWRSTRTLFEVDVGRDPTFREGRFHLAQALFAEGRPADADPHLQVLRAPDAGQAASWSYVNRVGVRELACANDLALRRQDSVSAELEALARSDPGLAARPSLRACLAQAREAQGRLAEALAIYEGIAAELPGVPPPTVSVAMARLGARLGRVEDARRWLDAARRDGPREPAFDAQLRQVERLLRPRPPPLRGADQGSAPSPTSRQAPSGPTSIPWTEPSGGKTSK